MLNLSTQGGREAFEHVKAGDLNGLSIGYQVKPGGAERQGGYRLLKALNLVEISIVTMPSNPRARIQLDSKGALEAVLTKSGLSKEAARRVAFGGWPALIGQEPSTPDYSKAADLADQMARATAQLKAMR